jgi:hypothetical protein
MKSMLRQKRHFLLALASLFILTSCGQGTSSQSEEPINWETPAAFDSKQLSVLFPSDTILSGYPEFERFDETTEEIRPLLGFTDFGKPFTAPESCRESDALLTQGDFVINTTSSATNYMKEGLSWRWTASDGGFAQRLTILIVGDSNTGENFLLNDIANELASCGTVANQTSGLTWSTIQTFTQPTPEILRVDYKIFFGSNTSAKGLMIARQVGRNVIYVSYTRNGKGLPSDFPISTEAEDEMNLLLDAVALKLNS